MNLEDMSPDFIKSLTKEQLSTLLIDVAANTKPEVAKAEVDNSEFVAPSRKILTKNQPVQATGENLFSDDGSDCIVDPETGEDFVAPKGKVAARTRKAPVMKTVTCNLCHDKFEKRADHVYGKYHVCHRCGGKR